MFFNMTQEQIMNMVDSMLKAATSVEYLEKAKASLQIIFEKIDLRINELKEKQNGRK